MTSSTVPFSYSIEQIYDRIDFPVIRQILSYFTDLQNKKTKNYRLLKLHMCSWERLLTRWDELGGSDRMCFYHYEKANIDSYIEEINDCLTKISKRYVCSIDGKTVSILDHEHTGKSNVQDQATKSTSTNSASKTSKRITRADALTSTVEEVNDYMYAVKRKLEQLENLVLYSSRRTEKRHELGYIANIGTVSRNKETNVVLVANGNLCETYRYDTCIQNKYENRTQSIAFMNPGSVTAVYAGSYLDHFAFGFANGEIEVKNEPTGTLLCAPATRYRHADAVLCLTLSQDGTRLVSGSRDNTVRVWEVPSAHGKLRVFGNPLPGHEDNVTCVAISGDGEYVASGSRDKTIRLWNIKSGESNCKLLTGHTDTILCVEFSDDGRYVVSGSRDRTVRIWDVENGTPFGEALIGHESRVCSVGISKGDRYIISGCDDNSIRIWDIETGKVFERDLGGCDSMIFYTVFNERGGIEISSWNDRIIQHWVVEVDDAFWTRESDQGTIGEEIRPELSLVINPSSGYFGDNYGMNMWKIFVKNEYVGELRLLGDSIYSLLQAFTPKMHHQYNNTMELFEELMELMIDHWKCAVIRIPGYGYGQETTTKFNEQRARVVERIAERCKFGITMYFGENIEYVFMMKDGRLSRQAVAILMRYVPGSGRLVKFLKKNGCGVNNCFLEALGVPRCKLRLEGRNQVTLYVHATWLSLMEGDVKSFLEDHCYIQDGEIWASNPVVNLMERLWRVRLPRNSSNTDDTNHNQTTHTQATKTDRKRFMGKMKDGSFYEIKDDKFVQWVIPPDVSSWLLTGAELAGKAKAGFKFGASAEVEAEGRVMLARGPEYEIEDELRHAHKAVIINLGVLNELYSTKQYSSRPELDERILALSKALLVKGYRIPENSSSIHDALVKKTSCSLREFSKWCGDHTLNISNLNHKSYDIVSSSVIKDIEAFQKLGEIKGMRKTHNEDGVLVMVKENEHVRLTYGVSKSDNSWKCNCVSNDLLPSLEKLSQHKAQCSLHVGNVCVV